MFIVIRPLVYAVIQFEADTSSGLCN